MADTTAPRGILPLTPVFTAAGTNPYDLGDVGSYANPSLVDIDADGDLDAFIGEIYGNTLVYLNTGTASSPAFVASGDSYGLGNVGYYASPSLVDIDGDGDLDAFIGNQDGNTLIYLNTGTASSPAFVASANSYGLGNVGRYASPSFVDIDGDGDLDALIGNRDGNTLVYLNTGTASTPAFVASANSYGLGDVGYFASPCFVDIDGDGDLDVFIGKQDGSTLVYLNTGTASSPAFVASGDSYGLGDVGYLANPSFVDIDGDGDLDAFIGNSAGNTLVYLNTGSFASPVTSATANGTYAAGSTITLQITFNENVIVNTTGGIPTLALSTGRDAVYTSVSGGVLTFTYTVQAGDSSADLDFTGTSALSLNGGTIQDAAGNDAVLTLAAPGATGSLRANANLVIDTVSPYGALAGTPVFAAPVVNLYGLGDVGDLAKPSLVDIDGDGDLDAFIGTGSGDTQVYLNTGTASSPAFVASANSYGLGDVGSFASPSFVDIDGDGDLDAFIGNSAGNTLVYLNTGTASSPAFVASADSYGLGDVGYAARPSFVDIDADGDLDALIGNYDGNTLVYLNTGTASSPAFVASANSYGLGDVGYAARPSFVDIDADGDLDALIGNQIGNTLVYLNTGTASSPAFMASANSYGIGDVGSQASPSFVDIDGDGDLDAFIGNRYGNTLVYLNNGSFVAPVTTTIANGTYAAGSTITLQITFNENVIVNTTGGTPTLALETGVTDRFAVYSGGSGTKVLTFTYTVEAGDGNADLDFTSSHALALNGGTIEDAAGNDAILTLAAPGAVGSLAASHDLVIDATAGAPTATLATAIISNTGSATVQSTETGMAYLVNTSVTVTDVASIKGADARWNAVAITSANTDTALAITGLADGTYRLYTTDAAGNLSAVSAASVTIDTTAPHGTVAGTPVFATPVVNLYGLGDVGYLANPSLVDIDGDGDLDAFIGNGNGNTLVYLNTGTASSPAFVASANSYGLGDVGIYASPSLVDIDGDGDLDALIGNSGGNTLVYLNTGTASSPAFMASANSYGLGDMGTSARPSFVDIDGDGDLDAFIGNSAGNMLVYLNTGTASSPAFVASADSYGLGGVGYAARPSFVDIDADGDLDALIGNYGGNTLVYLNTGTASSPAFVASANSYGLGDVGPLPAQAWWILTATVTWMPLLVTTLATRGST